MEWLREYWWLILLLLLGIILNGIRDLNRVSFKSYIDKKNGIKPSSSDKDKEQY